jgi:pyruvate/2-oxoglutarate dehydrogenase complex dihydrolipoamide dehydrogenase (E3) component
LLEKTDRLGGLVRRALAAPCKADTAAYLDYLEQAVRNHPSIQIRMNTEATPENVSLLAPHGVILATGSLPRTGELPMAAQAHGLDVVSLYEEPGEIGQQVIVVGGGASGCEAALHLAQQGKQVTLIERGDKPMPQFSRLPRIALLDQLNALGVQICTGLCVTEVTETGVLVQNSSGKVQSLTGDTVVIANGRRGDPETVRRFSVAASTVVDIGGCRRSGSLYHCISQGYFAGRNVEFY